jgi:lysyl-tRNA synthetase, class II
MLVSKLKIDVCILLL